MMKYRAYLMVIVLAVMASAASLVGLNHWVRGQIDTQASSFLERAGNRLVSHVRLKAFKMIQDLSHHQNDEKLLLALRKLPSITSAMTIENVRIALEPSHKETAPILSDIQKKIKMATNLALLTTDGIVITRSPDNQSFGDSMKGIPAVADCTQGVSRDGLYEIDGKPQLVAVAPIQNQRGNVTGCIMSFNQLGTTEAKALKQASGLDVAIFLRKILVASTLEPATVKVLIPQLNSREILWFGDPKEFQPLFVDYKGKAFAARATQLPSSTDLLHLVAIQPSTHFIAIHKKTQNVLLIGCGALLVFGLLLCFILSGNMVRANEAERLKNAAALLAEGGTTNIAAESYSGVFREIAHHLSRIAGIESKSGVSSTPEPISDLLGPYTESSPPLTSSDLGHSDNSFAAFENLLEKETTTKNTSTPVEPSADEYIGFDQEEENQAGFNQAISRNQIAPEEFESVDTAITPTPLDLIEASSSDQDSSSSAELMDESNSESPPTLSEIEIERHSSNPDPVDDFHREIFDQFVDTKKKCGESTSTLSFEVFSEKLRRNESDLKTRFNCSSVKFQVYVKNGKAALKASPIR